MFCSQALHTQLVQDLLALIAETRSAPASEREQRLGARLDEAGLGATVGEMLAVAERAVSARASEEELALALGLVIALSRASSSERS